jgi:SAM-dependent methyltransferase
VDAPETFAVDSGGYARNRPLYPRDLFAWIASACSARRTAWDCATGNGQAAIGLAGDFERVEASDVSPEQIRHGFAAPNIVYSVQPAERTGFPDAAFDLVAVAQALHWFDFELFWPEVRRVARPGAFFCAWGYGELDCEAALRAAFVDPLMALLEPYWAPNNRLLWDGYPSRDISFPFARVAAPAFAIEARWDISAVIGNVRTWSAYKRALADAAAAAAIARLEAAAQARFAGRGPMALAMPLAIAAGPISR